MISRIIKRSKKRSAKQQKFSKVLTDAKNALDSIGVQFHLHSGTALGAIREGQFIEHDHDIDLGVFRKDYKRNLVTAMKKHGFDVLSRGSLDFGKEYTFSHKKTGIDLDIFLVYSGKHQRKNIYWVASFLGQCNNKKYGLCRWKYRPYVPVLAKINDISVYSAPVSALEDGYGPNWSRPKKFDYFEGLEKGHYTNLIDE